MSVNDNKAHPPISARLSKVLDQLEVILHPDKNNGIKAPTSSKKGTKKAPNI
jgi:hypothetical protein